MICSFTQTPNDFFKFIEENLIVIAIVAVLVLAVVVLLIAKAVKKSKNKKQAKQIEEITQARHTDEGRYSLPEDVVSHNAEGEANASHIKHDVVVSKGQTVVAGKNNDIPMGKYLVLTTIDGVDAFNVRINGFVREIKHNSTIILGEGDSVCPVSHSIILR